MQQKANLFLILSGWKEQPAVIWVNILQKIIFYQLQNTSNIANVVVYSQLRFAVCSRWCAQISRSGERFQRGRSEMM